MYHIVKTKSKTQPFQVILVGENGEALSTSEGFKSKQSCYKNIKAQCAANAGMVVALIQDDTLKKPIAERRNFYESTSQVTEAEPKYIPGKNPKKSPTKKK